MKKLTKKELENRVIVLESAIKVYLLAIGKGEIVVYPVNSNDIDYIGLLEMVVK